MNEAVAALISAPQGGQALPDISDAPALKLFTEWCGLLMLDAPAGASLEEQTEFWAEVGDRQSDILDELQALPASPLQMLATIWVAIHDVHGFVSRDCPAMPNEHAGPLQTAVQYVAKLEPRLAAIAGVAA